jgi:hypothetical protein
LAGGVSFVLPRNRRDAVGHARTSWTSAGPSLSRTSRSGLVRPGTGMTLSGGTA